MARKIRLQINQKRFDLKVDDRRTLLEVLREDLGLTGTKEGCGTGDCGACTVVIDDQPVLSCLTLAIDCEGKAITTIEGLARDGQLHPLQKAFAEMGAVQCGFCTPGMIMAGYALLKQNSKPSEQEVKEAIAGNLCRCTGYVKIIEAILHAAGPMHDNSYGESVPPDSP
jgi:aerobic carbon-monoxide dehydrogenase small subunit